MSTLWLFILVLVYTLTCLFVIMTILLQSGKGGGLSSLGSGAGGALSDSLGATGAEKTLVKMTSWASGIFLVLSLVLTLFGAQLERTGGGLQLGASPAAPTAPAAPATAPIEGQPTDAGTAAPSETAPAAETGTQPETGQATSSQAPASTAPEQK